jgi:hypothetical protein
MSITTPHTAPPLDFQPEDFQHPYTNGRVTYAGVFGDPLFEFIAAEIIGHSVESAQWAGVRWTDPSCEPDLQRMLAAGFLQRDGGGYHHLTNDALYRIAERYPARRNLKIQSVCALRKLSAPIDELLQSIDFGRSAEAIDYDTYMAEYTQRVFPSNQATLSILYTLSIEGRQSDEIPGVVKIVANITGRGYDREFGMSNVPAHPEEVKAEIVPAFQKELEELLAELEKPGERSES